MKKLSVILTFLILTLAGCEKDSGIGLEIYLLEDYQTKAYSHEIISGSEKLSKDPNIYYTEIISYNATEHFFVIDPAKADQMRKKSWPTSGTPFALTINKQIIYSGHLIPGYSSSGSDWYSIDPLTLGGKLRVTLGYPGDHPNFGDADRRNDPRIINLLGKDNKLD
jgi:hypothetical protein